MYISVQYYESVSLLGVDVWMCGCAGPRCLSLPITRPSSNRICRIAIPLGKGAVQLNLSGYEAEAKSCTHRRPTEESFLDLDWFSISTLL